jgi:non-lysosomal glucosylceramidase
MAPNIGRAVGFLKGDGRPARFQCFPSSPTIDMSKPRCCSDSQCKPSSRREFLKFTGIGAAAFFSPRAFAGPFTADPNAGTGLDAKHPVPLDKKFSAAWLASLTARGKPSSWTDWAALQHIGMPVSGIGTGTVYLGGDGRLWCWDIFNVPHEGAVPKSVPGIPDRNGTNYLQPSKMESPWNVSHGLVLHIDGQPKRLDHTGFSQVEFTGQYPIGQVRLHDPASPVSVMMETYSPFIPLDYDNSSLPVTVMEVTVKNAGATAVKVELEAYLENAAVRYQASTNATGLRRVARVIPIKEGAMVTGEVITASEAAASTRPDILVSDFEKTTWENSGWVAEGEAFQTGPQAGTLPLVKGFQGKAYAHSHNRRLADKGDPDHLTGTLTSPPFKAERRYLSFLLVGGSRQEQLAVQLLLEGKVVHSLTGTDSNQFAPRSIDLTPWQGRELRVRLIDQAKGPWGSIGIDQLVLTDNTAAAPPLKSLRDHGSMALVILGAGAVAQAARGKSGPTAEAPLAEAQEMAVRMPLTIPGKGEIKTTVIMAWHFPQVHPGMGKLPDPRRWIAEKFADASAVAAHAIKELPYLSGQTRAFRDTWYGTEEGTHRGTLPHWLLERSLWTLSTLTTNVTYRLTNGRVWGWEGTGCCPGTCAHVWHYAQAAGRLFPQLEIDLRERTDFTPEVMTADGLIRFRGTYSGADHACIDGQAGILLRCYREHLSDVSGAFLKRNWPHIEKAAEFLVRAEATGKPGGNDGIFTQRFENTLDAKWGGEIPWIVGIYLAGLTAAAAMADEMGNQAAAGRWRGIIAKGRAAYAGYFDGTNGYYKAKCTPQDLLPVHVGPGSHIDMCLGDYWLAQVGLPPIGGKDQLRQAMDSLFKYNFVPDMGVFREQTKPHQGRYYALAGEGGLVMATWPHGGLPEQCKKAWQFMYFQECMSGFEHAAAALMVSLARDEGDPLLTQGLAVCRAIHDRYDATRRNPFNEIECSDHYARAMASYGVFIAATGFHCHAGEGLLRFEPKIGAKDFAGPFVGAGAWGRFTQKRDGDGVAASVEVRFGSLNLARLELAAPDGNAGRSTVSLDGRKLEHRTETRDGRLAVVLANKAALKPGQVLAVAVQP